MSVSDQTALILGGLILNYIIVYKKNRLIGNLIFLSIGLFTFIAPGTHAAISLIIFGTALVSTAYDLVITEIFWNNHRK